MKKAIITLSLFSITLLTYAQLKFISNTKEDMRLLGDSIVMSAKRHYIYQSEEEKEKGSFYIIRYVNTEDQTDILPVGVKVIMKGKNVDLEIEGTPIYSFAITQGKYLDLYPFWKQFIDPQADSESIEKKGRVKINKDNCVFYFQRDNKNWIIRMDKL